MTRTSVDITIPVLNEQRAIESTSQHSGLVFVCGVPL